MKFRGLEDLTKEELIQRIKKYYPVYIRVNHELKDNTKIVADLVGGILNTSTTDPNVDLTTAKNMLRISQSDTLENDILYIDGLIVPTSNSLTVEENIENVKADIGGDSQYLLSKIEAINTMIGYVASNTVGKLTSLRNAILSTGQNSTIEEDVNSLLDILASSGASIDSRLDLIIAKIGGTGTILSNLTSISDNLKSGPDTITNKIEDINDDLGGTGTVF